MVGLSNTPWNPDRALPTGSETSAFDGLPVPIVELVGRDQELDKLREMIPQARLVTLTGPGGIGKTQLALAAARRVAERFRDGAAFVELAPLTGADLVIPTIARTLGLWESGEEPPAAVLRRSLRNRHVLLVLDSFEHVLDAAPEIGGLLAACPDVHVLVTSRASLHLSGEHQLQVPPLALPDPRQGQDRLDLEAYAAVELFARRARDADPSFRVGPDNSTTVAEICRRLGGMPLAIELAAARTRVLSPVEVLARLDHQLGFLTGGPRDLPARLQTMRDAISWSYELLTTTERTLFRRLAVFAGGWTLEAAEAIAGFAEAEDPSSEGQEPGVLDTLSSLVDKSLVQSIRQELQATRFSMLDPIREFALEKLAEHGEEAIARDRHASYCLSTVAGLDAKLRGREGLSWLDRIETEHENLRASLRWLWERRHVDRGLRLAAELGAYWIHRGHLREGSAHLESFLGLHEASGRTVERAMALRYAAILRIRQGGAREALSSSEEACSIAEELGDRGELARALFVRAMADSALGDPTQARADNERSLKLFREIGDEGNIARQLSNLAWTLQAQGEIARSAALLEESLSISRARGDQLRVALAAGSLGWVVSRSGLHERAAELYRECLTLYRHHRDPWGVIVALEELAQIARERGNHRRAARLLGASSAQSERIGSPESERATAELKALRAALPEGAVEAFWLQGRTMSLDDAIAEALDTGPAASAPTAEPVEVFPRGLTAREVEVLRLIARGRSNREIAGDLVISERTVERHIENIYRKLEVHNRAGATSFALQHQLS